MMRLLEPLVVGDVELSSRVLMAPLTRSRSKQPGDIPWELNAEYYRQRAGAGLIISEATQISQQGKGYACTPGMYSDEQVEGWKLVTEEVRAKGGRIFAQLWHVGRISHVDLQPGGAKPVAPSAVRAESVTYTKQGGERVPVSEPRALELDEIPGIVDSYRKAAANAMRAGFDGVEIHGANGYLLDQFMRTATNLRTDAYGGSIENRARICLEVADAVAGEIGAGRVGYRVSPDGPYSKADGSDPVLESYGYLADELSERGIAYLHNVEAFKGQERNEAMISRLREAFGGVGRGGVYVGNGGLEPDEAERRVDEGRADAIAFGMLFISNPDLVERVRRGGPYAEANRETYYTGTGVGYTDYPALAQGVHRRCRNDGA